MTKTASLPCSGSTGPGLSGGKGSEYLSLTLPTHLPPPQKLNDFQDPEEVALE